MFRFFSLTHRLAIFFTMVAAGVVLWLGMLFLVATERHFLELDRITLQDKQHLIENIVVNTNSIDDIPSRLRESLNNHHHRRELHRWWSLCSSEPCASTPTEAAATQRPIRVWRM